MIPLDHFIWQMNTNAVKKMLEAILKNKKRQLQ